MVFMTNRFPDKGTTHVGAQGARKSCMQPSTVLMYKARYRGIS